MATYATTTLCNAGKLVDTIEHDDAAAIRPLAVRIEGVAAYYGTEAINEVIFEPKDGLTATAHRIELGGDLSLAIEFDVGDEESSQRFYFDGPLEFTLRVKTKKKI